MKTAKWLAVILAAVLALIAGCRSAEMQTIRLTIPKAAEGQLHALSITQVMYQVDAEVHQGKSVPVEVSPGRTISAQATDNAVAVGGGAPNVTDQSSGPRNVGAPEKEPEPETKSEPEPANEGKAD